MKDAEKGLPGILPYFSNLHSLHSSFKFSIWTVSLLLGEHAGKRTRKMVRLCPRPLARQPTAKNWDPRRSIVPRRCAREKLPICAQ